METINKWLTPVDEQRPERHPAAFTADMVVEKARVFAYAAHAAMGQKRKYTNEDYILHPMEVAEDVFRLTMIEDPRFTDGTARATIEQVIAAILHDVIEDTRKFVDKDGNLLKDPYKVIRSGGIVRLEEGITGHLIGKEFGQTVRRITEGLTEVAMPWDGNRDSRVAMNKEHLAEQEPDVKTVKLADIKHNIKNIAFYDPSYAIRYIKEKRSYLEVLGEGDSILFGEVKAFIDDFLRR